jgi:hypothetical protein
MSYIVMMKETNIIKDNTIRETVDGLHCHPWSMAWRNSKQGLWRLLGRDVHLLMQSSIMQSPSLTFHSEMERCFGASCPLFPCRLIVQLELGKACSCWLGVCSFPFPWLQLQPWSDPYLVGLSRQTMMCMWCKRSLCLFPILSALVCQCLAETRHDYYLFGLVIFT